MKTQAKSIEALTTEPGSNVEVYGQVTIVSYTKSSIILCAVFIRKQSKPYYHYRFKTTEARQAWIEGQKENEDSAIEARQAAADQGEESRKAYLAGAILYSSWGYEQTNIDFYQIVSRKGQFAVIQQVGQSRTRDDFDRGSCTPDVTEKIGEPFRKKIGNYGIRLESYSSASLWDGKPKGWSSYH